MDAARLQEQKRANDLFEKQLAPTPEQNRFRESADKWDSWLDAKDYSKGPGNDILNFDLWNPANIQKQSARMADLEGTGALGLGGKSGGNSSIALGLSKQHQADEAAQNAGASYENAVQSRNAYYEGNALPWSMAETNKIGSLLGAATQREQYYNNEYARTQKKSLLPQILGGALQMGSSLLGAFS